MMEGSKRWKIEAGRRVEEFRKEFSVSAAHEEASPLARQGE